MRLIDADALIQEWKGSFYEGTVDSLLDTAPTVSTDTDTISAQAEPPWIPVSERLPEGKQEVLVTEYGETDMGRRFDGRWLDRYGDKMKDVTAWMPLPEPYKGAKHE